MRQRVDLIQDAEKQLASVDVLIGDGNLARMNLTGHPSLVVAYGVAPERRSGDEADKAAEDTSPQFDMGTRRRPILWCSRAKCLANPSCWLLANSSKQPIPSKERLRKMALDGRCLAQEVWPAVEFPSRLPLVQPLVLNSSLTKSHNFSAESPLTLATVTRERPLARQ